jgi:hypothetical protein
MFTGYGVRSDRRLRATHKEVKEMVETTDLRKGRDQANASPMNLTPEQKEKVKNAIAQAVLDEVGADPREWFSVSWGRDAR